MPGSVEIGIPTLLGLRTYVPRDSTYSIQTQSPIGDRSCAKGLQIINSNVVVVDCLALFKGMWLIFVHTHTHTLNFDDAPQKST